MIKRLIMRAATVLLLVAPVGASEPPQDVIILAVHYGFTGVITKIESGVLFIHTQTSLQPCTVSPNKADRVGLHDAKAGDAVTLLVDSGNAKIDVSRTDRFFPDHRFVVGTARHAEAMWQEIQLPTSEGFSTFEVDVLV